MIDINVDEEKLQDEIQKRVKEAVESAETDLVLWDTKELRRRTCMSWNTIKEHFFYDPRCPKMKIGGKCYFPAEEMKAFLMEWVEEQKKVSPWAVPTDKRP
ncbi:hypothetical protein [Salimicrobium salexigens]|uniref:Helix-turn-helix domain-containing protein n=1 Tax=Salimicrobium salexigens TaxID=908941 RepID=A0ABY1KPV3_9BACI|nr:hypothetical protein [Salimicrobium salexigens]SIS49253.1 hypothetical protein SAMN05421758_1027 [Salimicrobium salexigens]